MSKKTLPRAITPAAGASPRDDTSSPASPKPDEALPEPAVKAAAQSRKPADSTTRPKGRSATKAVSAPASVTEPVAAASAAEAGASGGRSGGKAKAEPAAGARAIPAAAPRTGLKVDPALRRERAFGIVDRYVKYSALSSLIPIPLVDVAAVTAIVVRMAKALSGHYGVPFERARVRALVSGMIGGAAAPGLAAVGTSTAMKLVPGVQLVGLAVTSAMAAAWTRGIGEMFVDGFEGGAGYRAAI